jgi:hypothetical protein
MKNSAVTRKKGTANPFGTNGGGESFTAVAFVD